MSTEYWAGVVTLLMGWSLKEFSDRLRLRREERKPFAVAIVDLLEMRHRFLSVSTTVGELKKRLPITCEAEAGLRTFFRTVLAQPKELEKRYNEAVSLISGIDPILAFRLRCKDEFSPFIEKLYPLLTVDNLTRPLLVQIEDKLSSVFIKDVEELVTELARAHGLTTWWKIRRRLSKPLSIPDEVDELFRLLDRSQPTAQVS